jgi:CHASE3 domain sensor protein
MAEDEVGDAVKRRVEAEIKAIRERMETDMKERLEKIEREFNQSYRHKILVVLAGIVALMVAGAMTSTMTATRKANEAVIGF